MHEAHSTTRLRHILALFGVLVSCALFANPGRIAAHAEIERSSPPADAVLAAPPHEIELWTTEPVATGAGSPDIRVLDETGNALPISDLTVDQADARHVSAKVDGVGYGTFTVSWSLRSDTDGHTLSGTFAFRVGGTSRAPGAATVEGETPAPWAVATRWFTFLAAAIAAAGFLFGLVVLRGTVEDSAVVKKRAAIVSGAALVGIVATLAEPVFQTIWPPADTLAPSLNDAFSGQPAAWLLRAPALFIAAVAARRLVARGARRPVELIGGAAGLVALLGLALTSHASARESLRPLALASIVLHQWAVGLWVGGLIALVVSRPLAKTGDDGLTPVARFSRFALWLAPVGIVTGVVNAGFVLPKLSSLWDSDYGRILIVKLVVLVPVLALATLHRARLRRASESVLAAFRLTLRIEALLIVVVVLGGSMLALSAPPVTSRGTFENVDFAAPLPDEDPATNYYVRLIIDPADQGENAFAVSVTDGEPVSIDSTGSMVNAPSLTDVELVRLTLTNLNSGTAPASTDLTAGPDGTFVAGELQIGLDGWWHADVLVRRAGALDVSVPFYFILPDPNVHGESAVPVPDSAHEAEAVFQSGLAGLTSLHSVHFVERLGGGTGLVVLSDHITHDGAAGQPAALQIATDSSEMIRTEGKQWVREAGEDWIVTDAGPVVPPSAWGLDYERATSFRLGGQEQVAGRAAQIVTFYVPGDAYASAWYAWWVDVETGRILRETMVSRGHYMEREFDGFDSAPPVTPPT